jgi:hypothetical protein
MECAGLLARSSDVFKGAGQAGALHTLRAMGLWFYCSAFLCPIFAFSALKSDSLLVVASAALCCIAGLQLLKTCATPNAFACNNAQL